MSASSDTPLYRVPVQKPEILSCPHCGSQFFKELAPHEEYFLPPDNGNITARRQNNQVRITFLYCPSCREESIHAARSSSRPFSSLVYPRIPKSELPDYVPQAIQADYTEACAIVELSPKAAATLCRRCLQGMIHDIWNIHEKNLNAELSSLKSRISQKAWQAIDSLRQIGNIGAHMENDASLIIDIEPEEASVLIQLIEYLIFEWYIKDHESESLFESINHLNQSLQSRRSRHADTSADPAPR